MKQKMLVPTALQLQTLLDSALSQRILTKRIGLLFSGGLDSSLLAAILRKLRDEFPLLVVGIPSAKDITTARTSAQLLNQSLTIQIITKDEVKENLSTILDVTNTADVLQISLAIPLFFASKTAKKLNLDGLVSGQGADELFGGYARYEQGFIESGVAVTLEEMKADLVRLQKETFPLQQAIAQYHKQELLTPFLDSAVIAFVEDLPFHYKIADSKDGIIRKLLLRCLAQQLNLPSIITDQPKRAMQYGSGAHRILENLAAEYWKQRKPSLSSREIRSHSRIYSFLRAQLSK